MTSSTALRLVPNGPPPDEDARARKAAADWLNGAPIEFLLCRNNHHFPKLRPKNGRLPKGVTATPMIGRLGSFQVRQKCSDCGLPRVFTYQAGTDLFAASRHYSYDYASLPGYRQPKGAAQFISSADCKAEAYAREGIAELLVAAAGGVK
jgi:hypothetical protein